MKPIRTKEDVKKFLDFDKAFNMYSLSFSSARNIDGKTLDAAKFEDFQALEMLDTLLHMIREEFDRTISEYRTAIAVGQALNKMEKD